MTRRLVDNEIWKKDWYLDLSIKQKLLVKFLYDNCDCAGIYEISYRMLNYCFNEEITKEDFDGIKQIRFIDNDKKIFIEDFINFQYGVAISELRPNKNNVHKGVYKSLVKNGLVRVQQPLLNPCPSVQDKDKYKDKDIDNNKYKENFKKFWDLCPKQTNELNCYRTYIYIIDNKIATFEEIEKGMKEYAGYIKENNITQQYILSPFNWLSGRRWQDNITKENKKMSILEKIGRA